MKLSSAGLGKLRPLPGLFPHLCCAYHHRDDLEEMVWESEHMNRRALRGAVRCLEPGLTAVALTRGLPTTLFLTALLPCRHGDLVSSWFRC